MSNQGLLTVADILELGCQQGQNPGLLGIPAGETDSYALKALRVWLHHVYLNYDLPKLETEASVASTNDYEISLSALTRYRSINGLYLNNVGRIWETQGGYKELWYLLQDALSQSPSLKGIPQQFAITPDKSKILLYPIPTVVYTGKLLYYRIPDQSAITLASTAADLEFEDTSVLVRVVEAFARNWDGARGDLLGFSMGLAKTEFGEYRASAEDLGRADGQQTVKLSKKWYNYRRGD